MSLIVACILANILPYVINPAQQGFIKGRSATSNIRKVVSVLEQAKRDLKADIAIMSPDAVKAFDSIQLPWLFLTLQKIGSTGNALAFIQQMYKTPTAWVMTPGALSGPIELQKGTEQGCPLSPLLFNIALEPLYLYLQHTNRMTG